MAEQTLNGEIFAEADDEHRREQRKKTLKTGDIVFERQQCLMQCVIMDLSTHGAKLKVGDPLNCPSRFRLHIGDDNTHLCEVAWRDGTYVGARFLEGGSYATSHRDRRP